MKRLLTLVLLPALLTLSACGQPQGKILAPSEDQQDLASHPGEDEGQIPTDVPTDPSDETGSRDGDEDSDGGGLPFVEAYPEDATKFNKPWGRKDTMIVIDAYQGNSMDWEQMKSDKRVVAVIHRATIGTTVDTKYRSRQALANQYGYLWGAYHLGKAGNPIGQAKKFLETVGDVKNVLLVLDLENTSGGSFMNASEAKQFMDYVYDQTGKVPVIYANHSVTGALSAKFKNDRMFLSSRLWYARFRTNIPDFPDGLWPTYFLWQFSSELNCSSTGSCLYNVPGTKFDMDVNVFYGSKEALAYEWRL
jgi:GH25 family lysozyme M1 (1,4-beta-N-acetylmuramidase)